jgi:hypothetical protein
MDGFDASDTSIKWQSSSGTPTTVTRFGTGRSILFGQYTGITYGIQPAISTMFISKAMALYAPSGAELSFLYIYGDNAATLHLALSFTATGVVLRRGAGGTVLATCSFSFAHQIYHSVEIMATIADAGGICKVKINGVLMIDYSGDTKNGGTNTTIDSISYYMGNNGGMYLDDFVLYDATGSAPYNDFLGDVRIQTSSPSAAGNSTQFTPSSGANYTTVDELPYSAADYVSAVPSGTKDTYAMTDLSGTPSYIYATQTNLVAKKTDAGPVSLRPIVRSGGVDYAGTSIALLASDRTLTHIRTTDPNTATTWTTSGVNNLQAGMEIV